LSGYPGAFLELYLHAVLSLLGKVTVTGSSEGLVPDFAVHAVGGTFLVESVVVEPTTRASGRAARVARVLDTVGKIRSPDFIICADVHGDPGSDLNLKRLVKNARHWVESLDRTSERRRLENGFPGPSREQRVGGMTLRLTALPRRASLEAEPEEGLSAHTSGDTEWQIDVARGLWTTLEKKFDHYQAVQHPLVVAVNDIRPIYAELEEYRGVLLGRCVGFPLGGLWWHGGRPRHGHISAILCFEQTLQPWTVARTEPRLILNSWAVRPLGPAVLPLASYGLAPKGHLNRLRTGVPIGDLLGLAPDLPGPDS
jgi:hypothetical protein